MLQSSSSKKGLSNCPTQIVSGTIYFVLKPRWNSAPCTKLICVAALVNAKSSPTLLKCDRGEEGRRNVFKCRNRTNRHVLTENSRRRPCRLVVVLSKCPTEARKKGKTYWQVLQSFFTFTQEEAWAEGGNDVTDGSVRRDANYTHTYTHSSQQHGSQSCAVLYRIKTT